MNQRNVAHLKSALVSNGLNTALNFFRPDGSIFDTSLLSIIGTRLITTLDPSNRYNRETVISAVAITAFSQAVNYFLKNLNIAPTVAPIITMLIVGAAILLAKYLVDKITDPAPNTTLRRT